MTERQIVKVCEIDLMAGLHLPSQLCGQYEAKENVNREHENEVRRVVAQARPPPVYPILNHPFCCLRSTKQIQAETDQPFGVHIVDDGICHPPRILQACGFSPTTQLTHDGLHHSREIDSGQSPAPLPGYVALNVQKFSLRPSLKRFLFWASLENNTLLVAQLDGFSAGQDGAKENLLHVELPHQFAVENVHVMDVRVALCLGCAIGQRANKLFRRAFAADGFFKIGQAFDKEKRSDVRHVKVVEQNRLVEI